MSAGSMGVVLLWFMFKSEPRLRAMEAAVDRLARSILLLIISIPQSTRNVKTQAEGIVREIDEAEKQ